MQWMVETLNHLVDAEIEALPPLLNARLIRLMEMVENIGLEQMREPHVKHIEGKIWELRAKAAEGIAPPSASPQPAVASSSSMPLSKSRTRHHGARWKPPATE
jgi:hypothetical protein